MPGRRTRIAGLAIAGTGVAHFVAPSAFEPVSRLAFPEDTRRWVLRNGATELAIGLLLASGRAKGLGLAGLAAYTAFLGVRALRSGPVPARS